MLRRHPESVFAADAWVFPGGRVDDGDRGRHADRLRPHRRRGQRQPSACPRAGWPSGWPPPGSASRRRASCSPATPTPGAWLDTIHRVERRPLGPLPPRRPRRATHPGRRARGRGAGARPVGCALRLALDHPARVHHPPLRHPVLRGRRAARAGRLPRRRRDGRIGLDDRRPRPWPAAPAGEIHLRDPHHRQPGGPGPVRRHRRPVAAARPSTPCRWRAALPGRHSVPAESHAADPRPRRRSSDARPDPGVASALSPLVRRIVAPNPGHDDGPGHQHLPGRHRRGGRHRPRPRRRRPHRGHRRGVDAGAGALDPRHPPPHRPLGRRGPSQARRPVPRSWPSARPEAAGRRLGARPQGQGRGGHRGHRVGPRGAPHARATPPTTCASSWRRSGSSSPATPCCPARPPSSTRPTATWPPTSSPWSGSASGA